MGEFHAEDYKILAGSVEQNIKRDGKTRFNENKDLKSRRGNKFSGTEYVSFFLIFIIIINN